MPRQARIDAPGSLHHIIIRGIERKRIFRDDEDRDDFVARHANTISETSTLFLQLGTNPKKSGVSPQ